MKLGGLLVCLSLGLLLLVSCGGESTPSPARQTLDAARGDAEKTPVDEPVQAYARQLCDPFGTFFDSAKDTLSALEATPALDDADFGDAISALGELQEPLENFRDDLQDVDPPDELRDYHNALVEEMDYAVEVVKAVKEGGIFGAFAVPSPPPTAENPEGFEAAIVQECGDEFADIIDGLGSDFLGGEEPAPTGEAPEPGTVGQTIRNGNFELLVHSIEDPYEGSDEFFQPEPGNRWVVVDVSITNVSTEAQDYAPFDFKLKDVDNFEYDPGFVDLPQSLSSGSLLPDDTVRGRIGFEIPASSDIVRLIFNPGFFGEGRIDV